MPIGLTATAITNNGAQIARQISKRKRELLNAFGQDTRDQAQRIQTAGDGISAPGRPAKVHSGSPNLESIQHAVVGDTVTVGAIGFQTASSPIGMPLPALLEFGGRVIIRPRRRTSTGRKLRRPRSRVVTYQARPTIRPASTYALRRLQKNARRLL